MTSLSHTPLFDASTASQKLSLLTILDIQRELAELRRKIQEDVRRELRTFLQQSRSLCANNANSVTATLQSAKGDVCPSTAHVSTTGHDAILSLTSDAFSNEKDENVNHELHVPGSCDDAPHTVQVAWPDGDSQSANEHDVSNSVAPLSTVGALRSSLRASFMHSPGTPDDIVHESDSNSTTRKCSRLSEWKILISGLLQGRSAIHEFWMPADTNGFEKVMSRVRSNGVSVMSAAQSNSSWSPVDESEESKAWWVIDPFSTRRVAWDLIGIAFCLYDLIMVPVVTAFTMSASYESYSAVRETFGACFWTLDMLVSCATGTLDRDGLVEFRPRKIARKYLTTWFVFDLIIVTTDWVVIFFNALGSSGSMRMSKAFTRILRASRLLRILKISEKVQEVLGTVESESIFTVGKVIKNILLFFVICHYFACAWYVVGTMQDDNRSWIHEFLSDNDTNLYSYAVSLHFSLTQFTFGHTDITPEAASEFFFASFLLVAALLVFSFFTSNMSRVVAHLEEVNASELAQDVLIRRFCAENNVPRRLMARMRNFKRQRSRGYSRRKVSESDVEIFQALPVAIVQQLREYRYMPHLLEHPVLQQCFTMNPKTLLELCWSGIEDVFLLPDQDFFRKGKHINRMIFLQTGKLRYYFREGNAGEDAAIILPGQWACEETLWSQTSWLFGPFIACDASQLMLLVPEKLREIMCRDLICRQFLSQYAMLFVQAFNNASCDESDECVLFNDPITIKGMVETALQEHVKSGTSIVLQNPGYF